MKSRKNEYILKNQEKTKTNKTLNESDNSTTINTVLTIETML